MTFFSRATLDAFEDASASIPLRQIDRAFEGAGIRLGPDPTEDGGARRVRFRRYVASVDQHDSRRRDRLGDALGALIAEVAASKVAFLVSATERDGFSFAGGAFRAASTTAATFALVRIEDLAGITDRERRLNVLAEDRPRDAVAGANALLESVCSLDASRSGEGDSDGVAFARALAQLRAVVTRLAKRKAGLSSRHARLAIGASVTFARFVAEASVARAAERDDA